MNGTHETPSSYRVLVVDDDEDIRANIADILRDLDYHVTLAADGTEALQHVRDRDFDVVLLDYKMPGIDGATLYREIKQIRPALVAIMVTAYAAGNGIQQALQAGTWDVLRKPVDIAELLAKIEQATRARLVLVVDDDEGFCQTLWHILNERQYRVALAYNEADGIRQLRQRRHHVALVDIKLGVGSGRSVIRQINDSQADTSTIVISGHHHEAKAMLDEFGARGVRAVCPKPIDLDNLLETIADVAN